MASTLFTENPGDENGGLHGDYRSPSLTGPSGQLAYIRITFEIALDRINRLRWPHCSIRDELMILGRGRDEIRSKISNVVRVFPALFDVLTVHCVPPRATKFFKRGKIHVRKTRHHFYSLINRRNAIKETFCKPTFCSRFKTEKPIVSCFSLSLSLFFSPTTTNRITVPNLFLYFRAPMHRTGFMPVIEFFNHDARFVAMPVRRLPRGGGKGRRTIAIKDPRIRTRLTRVVPGFTYGVTAPFAGKMK